MARQVITRVGVALFIVLVALIAIPNARSLYEGIFFYIPDMIAHPSLASYAQPARPIRQDGRYGSLYKLVQLRNAGRLDFLVNHLEAAGVTVVRVPIAGSTFPSLFVRFNPSGPYTLFSAHYDKLYDDTNYQGASDNTAADSVLLAAVVDLAQHGYRGSAAFLFTGEEEKGLKGAAGFMEYARATSLQVRENVNLDNIGRGRLAIRPSVDVPGYAFTIPLSGEWTYDGRELSRSGPVQPANAKLTQALLRVQPDIVVYERFTALSDSNVFQANGLDTVAISGDDMHFLELTWHTYEDRVQLLDEENLDRAFDLITRLAAAN